MSSWREESWSLRSTLEGSHGLDRDEELFLLVGVAPGDQPQDLPLAGRQPVEVLVDRGHVDVAGEGVEHEARQPGREDGVTVGDPPIASRSSAPVMVLVT